MIVSRTESLNSSTCQSQRIVSAVTFSAGRRTVPHHFPRFPLA